MDHWIVMEIDPDGQIELIGLFDSDAEAHEWSREHVPTSSSYSVHPLCPKEEAYT